MNPTGSHAAPLPNGQHRRPNIPVVKKKPKAVDPLFRPRKKPAFKPTVPPTRPQANGAPPPIVNPRAGLSPAPVSVPSPGGVPVARNDRQPVSGFSDPNGSIQGVPYRDYKVVITKRDLVEGLRYHGLQFNGDKPIDICNEADFTRPVRLHRRDPRSTGLEQAQNGKTPMAKDDPSVEDKEEIDKQKEARRLEREANLAQVAPSVDVAKRPVVAAKKTAQVYNRDYTPDERRKMQNNYEEKLPWHIEDFDSKHCYVGSNQAGSTSIYAAFVHDQSSDAIDRFRVLPIEKMYQFKRRKTFRTMTIEEAESAMERKGRDPQWLVDKRSANMQEAQLEQVARRGKAFFGTKDDTAAGRGDEGADLDFNVEEDFADDEEGDMFFDKDEDEKLAERRIKEDQLNANIFGIKEETEYDQAEAKERKEKERKKLIGKGIRKALERREKNFDLGSDSDDPFGSTSESEDTEAERRRLEAEKKSKAEKEAKRSGLSTGSNTPSGRKEKHGGTASDRDGGDLKKAPLSKSLKRPGSPNLSDASGTDASLARKKKKNGHLSSSQGTSQPSRPTSPANVPPSSSAPAASTGVRGSSNSHLSQLNPTTGTEASANIKSNKKRKSLAAGAGAGSDTDTAAALSDGGAMSDNSRQQKRLKLNLSPSNPAAGTADRSRTPQTTTTTTSQRGANNNSRAPSPKPTTTATNTNPPQPQAPGVGPDPSTYPTPTEVYAAIPPAGITTNDLSNKFRSRYRKEDRGQMLNRIREVARFDKSTKLLFRADGARPA